MSIFTCGWNKKCRKGAEGVCCRHSLLPPPSLRREAGDAFVLVGECAHHSQRVEEFRLLALASLATSLKILRSPGNQHVFDDVTLYYARLSYKTTSAPRTGWLEVRCSANVSPPKFKNSLIPASIL